MLETPLSPPLACNNKEFNHRHRYHHHDIPLGSVSEENYWRSHKARKDGKDQVAAMKKDAE